jgi:SAM-dependent methyltransferase
MKFEPRNCPICSNDSKDIHAEQKICDSSLNEFSFSSRKEPELMHLRLFFCSNCNLIYANPGISNEAVKEEYEKSAFDSSAEEGFAARTYFKYLPDISKINSCLDIGCGGGSFLKELKKLNIKKLAGIDPAFSAIDTSDKSIKSLIKQGFFEADSFSEKFDMISCFQTVEHLTDPLKLCKDVYASLNDGGIFYGVAHNFEGVMNRMMGKKSPIYDIEHMQLYSPKSIKKLLEEAGFKKIEVRSIVNTYPAYYWIKLLPLLPFKSQLMKFSKQIRVGCMPVALPVGNMAFYAYK